MRVCSITFLIINKFQTMARIISASINLSKIDKTKIFKGEKGLYYNVSIIVNDEANDYGQDVLISQEQTKQEREAKASKIYIGNGKTVWSNLGNGTTTQSSNASHSDDLPFD